jgi:predicted MPP superfamily phosphohydrolase
MRKVLSFLSVFTILLVNGLDKKLQFNKDGKFKIVQLTDLHFGENDEADANNQRLIRDILD